MNFIIWGLFWWIWFFSFVIFEYFHFYESSRILRHLYLWDFIGYVVDTIPVENISLIGGWGLWCIVCFLRPIVFIIMVLTTSALENEYMSTCFLLQSTPAILRVHFFSYNLHQLFSHSLLPPQNVWKNWRKKQLF